MSTLGDLARRHTHLNRDQIRHLNLLMAEWGLLADLSFADLLLYVPCEDGAWRIMGQVRPATGQTIYQDDYVGQEPAYTDVALLARVLAEGVIIAGETEAPNTTVPARIQAIPVRFAGAPIAVLGREWSERSGRQPGGLERTYLALFERFAGMIAEGSLPYEGQLSDFSAAPRVGDGALVLDQDGRVHYGSPNAISALHRVGIAANAVGMRLADLGFNDSIVQQAYERQIPVIQEFDQTPTTTFLARCLPLLANGSVTGGILLLRDVTEVRTRDKLLLSKDATIREIHHRVKNNLQTISSLLRLQGRRLSSPEAKAAVAESVRRIRTIALVHETLSREPGDDVTFLEIVRPLMRLAEEGLQSPDRPIRFEVLGDAGRVPSRIATSLSVVLTELLQNAVDHGYPDDDHRGGHVVVWLSNDGDALEVRVLNDGRPLAAGFDIEEATGLGLSIVRTLVDTELEGRITMRRGRRDDFAAVGLVAETAEAGTLVELTVPVAAPGSR